MNGNIKDYFDSIAGNLPPEIISPETYSQIFKMADLFTDFAASEYIMETHLNSEDAQVDFSFRVLAEKEKFCLIRGLESPSFSTLTADENWSRINDYVNSWSPHIKDIWLEMDCSEYGKEIPQPCFFFNASQIKKGTAVDEQLLFNVLKKLLEIQQLESLWPNFKKAIHQLPDEVGLFQVGVMLARSSDRVRIFTAELTWEQLLDYLSKIDWRGSFPKLQEVYELVNPYSDGQYILDFDVNKEGISEKIGINFGLKTNEILPDFLEMLISNHLCTDMKRIGVIDWSGSMGSFLGRDYGFSALIKDISHFKIAYSPEEALKAKAYLRVAGVYMKELFKNQNFKPAYPNQEEAENKLMGYKEIQNLLKEITIKSVLDQDYRELCLADSQAAIQKVIKQDMEIPVSITFLEEDDGSDYGGSSYILPPFIKKSWLLSK